MVEIGDEIKDFIEENPALVATSSSEGVPNVVPKGSLQLLDDENLVYAELFDGTTTGNIKENPNVSVSVVDFEEQKGYQLKGEASLLDSGGVYEKVVEAIENLPMDLPKPQYAVKIKVGEIFNLTPGPDAGEKVK